MRNSEDCLNVCLSSTQFLLGAIIRQLRVKHVLSSKIMTDILLTSVQAIGTSRILKRLREPYSWVNTFEMVCHCITSANV